ncbi:MAG: hypothetical protein EA417_09065 [Gammaproteobacteria bacterium]|nr:MAG: hypothetical protein EA417_09065 [Gammaproteobacteria bacterium]
MARPGRFRLSSAHPWWRRAYYRALELMGRPRFKSHRASFIDFPRQRFKQVRFSNASEARRVEENLRALRPLGVFPRFLFRLEGTVWTQFAEGVRVDPKNPEHVSGVLAFFASLYGHEPTQVDVWATDLQQRLLDNLHGLVAMGELDDAAYEQLAALAERLRPEQVWMGSEYIDPLPKNFVVTADGVVGIDAEALYRRELLGIGLAKAELRWLKVERDALITALIQHGGPDLASQYDYANLYFLAHYGIQSVLRGKGARGCRAAMESLLRQHAPQGT